MYYEFDGKEKGSNITKLVLVFFFGVCRAEYWFDLFSRVWLVCFAVGSGGLEWVFCAFWKEQLMLPSRRWLCEGSSLWCGHRQALIPAPAVAMSHSGAPSCAGLSVALDAAAVRAAPGWQPSITTAGGRSRCGLTLLSRGTETCSEIYILLGIPGMFNGVQYLHPWGMLRGCLIRLSRTPATWFTLVNFYASHLKIPNNSLVLGKLPVVARWH